MVLCESAMFTVYLITNLVNGKVYVGQTKMRLNRRWQAHRSAAERYEHRPFCCAIQKHGSDVFEIRELAIVQSKESANSLERIWIILLRSTERPCGYNLTLGGDGGLGYVQSQETKDKRAVALRGKKRSARSRERISQGLMGKVVSPETRAKQRVAKLERHRNS